MNIFLWILRVVLALHTAIGAIWKFSHSAEQTMISLSAIPRGVWLGMGVFELLCALGLVLPAVSKPLAMLTPIAAACIATEMFAFVIIHFRSGDSSYGPVVYWLVVAALCAGIIKGSEVFAVA